MEPRKFQIYFASHTEACKTEHLSSFTLSLSRINEQTNTYKLKLITEVANPSSLQATTYKLKEFHMNARKVISLINKIDFTKDYGKVDTNKDLYCIKFEDKKIMTSDKEAIMEILKVFHFDELMAIPVNQYSKIKDVYEFLTFTELFMTYSQDLSDEQFERVYDYFLNKDPYKVFENFNTLDTFRCE